MADRHPAPCCSRLAWLAGLLLSGGRRPRGQRDAGVREAEFADRLFQPLRGRCRKRRPARRLEYRPARKPAGGDHSRDGRIPPRPVDHGPRPVRMGRGKRNPFGGAAGAAHLAAQSRRRRAEDLHRRDLCQPRCERRSGAQQFAAGGAQGRRFRQESRSPGARPAGRKGRGAAEPRYSATGRGLWRSDGRSALRR